MIIKLEYKPRKPQWRLHQDYGKYKIWVKYDLNLEKDTFLTRESKPDELDVGHLSKLIPTEKKLISNHTISICLYSLFLVVWTIWMIYLNKP